MEEEAEEVLAKNFYMRDYFAAQALTGLILCKVHPVGLTPAQKTENLALNAYAIADEMLKAREKEIPK